MMLALRTSLNISSDNALANLFAVSLASTLPVTSCEMYSDIHTTDLRSSGVTEASRTLDIRRNIRMQDAGRILCQAFKKKENQTGGCQNKSKVRWRGPKGQLRAGGVLGYKAAKPPSIPSYGTSRVLSRHLLGGKLPPQTSQLPPPKNFWPALIS